MVCPRCGFENSKRSRYCRMCGVTFTRQMKKNSGKKQPVLMLPEKTSSHPTARQHTQPPRTAGGTRPPAARQPSPYMGGDGRQSALRQDPYLENDGRPSTARQSPYAGVDARQPAARQVPQVQVDMRPPYATGGIADEPKVLPLYDDRVVPPTKYELRFDQPTAPPVYESRPPVQPPRAPAQDPQFNSVFQSHDEKEYDEPKPADIQWFIFAAMFFVLSLLVTFSYVKFIATFTAALVIMGGIGGLVSLIILIMKAVHRERKLTPAIWLVVYALIVAFAIVKEYIL